MERSQIYHRAVLRNGNGNLTVAIAVALAYGVAVLIVVPPSRYAYMLGAAAVLLAGVALLARARRSIQPFFMSVLIMVIVAAVVLVVPNFPAMGGPGWGTAAVGFIGVQAAALLWTALRWEPWPPRATRIRLLLCLFAGLGGGIGLSLIASIPILLALISDGSEALPILWAFPAYVLGGLIVGLVAWTFQDVTRHPTGRYIVGGLAGTLVYVLFGPIVAVIDGDAVVWQEILEIGVACGWLVGPAVAMAIADGWRE